MTITEDAAAALAVLTYALDEPTTDLADSLRRLTLETATAVTSYLGLSVVVAQNDPPLTITATADGGLVGPIRASLHIWLSGRGQAPEPVGIALILYAGAPGAYVDLAADLAWRTGRPPAEITLDQHLTVPTAVDIADRLRAASDIDQAIGVLIGRGHTPEQARRHLDSDAADNRTDRHTAARSILDGVGMVVGRRGTRQRPRRRPGTD
ncbi:hypothetical protein GCM10023147_37960 [Tsukamurella soli]|uniref:ANTAR domain-containing protein n=1 Tax=Tsukamurella soli TaxID=644556 RepID=A0ABP8K337_9ACTN